MGDRLLQGALGSADGQGAAPVEAGAVKKFHELIKTPTLGTDEVLLGYPHVFEGNLSRIGAADRELAVELIGLIPCPVGFDYDRAHPVVGFRVLRVREAEDDEVVSDVRIGDKHLVPVNNIVGTVFDRGRGDCRHIASRVGLGGCHACPPGPVADRGEVLLPLGLGTEELDHLSTEVACHHTLGNATVYPGEFFDDETLLEVAEARASVLLGNENAQEAILCGLFPDRIIEPLVVVHVPGDFCELLFGEFSGCLLDVFLFGGELEHPASSFISELSAVKVLGFRYVL